MNKHLYLVHMDQEWHTIGQRFVEVPIAKKTVAAKIRRQVLTKPSKSN